MESTQAVADPKIEKRSVGGSVSTTVIEIDFDELCRSQIEIKKLEARKEIEELEVPIIKNTEKERKDYMKEVEKEVFRDYEGDMQQMSLAQGKLLIKLIDRETSNTSYELIRDYRGKVPAAFWQGVARIFGTNLKAEYDPYGEDAIIERIVTEIEAGRL